MTATTITIERIDTLLAILETAHESVTRLRQDVAEGELPPGEAVADLNETIETIRTANR